MERLSLDDEQALRHLAYRYSQALDRRQPEIFDEIFAGDAVITSSRMRFQGLAEIRGLIPWLAGRWLKTFHAVFNQVAVATPQGAEAETYCRASHLFRGPTGAVVCTEMWIRYKDRFVRTAQGWRFSARAIIFDWEAVHEARIVDDAEASSPKS